MTKYYAVDVRGVTDTTAWYNQMEALGFNLEDHGMQQSFNNIYWFYFDKDKNYITFLCEDDCDYNYNTDSYEYNNDLDGAEQWFIDNEDYNAYIEEIQLPTNSLYYGQL